VLLQSIGGRYWRNSWASLTYHYKDGPSQSFALFHFEGIVIEAPRMAVKSKGLRKADNDSIELNYQSVTTFHL